QFPSLAAPHSAHHLVNCSVIVSTASSNSSTSPWRKTVRIGLSLSLGSWGDETSVGSGPREQVQRNRVRTACRTHVRNFAASHLRRFGQDRQTGNRAPVVTGPGGNRQRKARQPVGLARCAAGQGGLGRPRCRWDGVRPTT